MLTGGFQLDCIYLIGLPLLQIISGPFKVEYITSQHEANYALPCLASSQKPLGLVYPLLPWPVVTLSQPACDWPANWFSTNIRSCNPWSQSGCKMDEPQALTADGLLQLHKSSFIPCLIFIVDFPVSYPRSWHMNLLVICRPHFICYWVCL